MPQTVQPNEPVVIRNNAMIGIRAFMVLWDVLLGGFTYFFERQERHDPHLHPAGQSILGLLLLFGIIGTFWCFTRPRTVVTAAAGSMLVREIWLWRRARERRYAAADVFVPHLEVDEDTDGGPYFKCRVWLPKGRMLTVSEGFKQSEVEADRRRLLAVLGKRS